MIGIMAHVARIAVLAMGDDADARAAVELASELHLPLLRETDAAAADLILEFHNQQLSVRGWTMRPGRGLVIDFKQLRPRAAGVRGGFSRNQPLGRAIGKKTHHVFDATAGLGHDAALMACMGYDVMAAERSPVLAALLRDAMRRAELDDELREALGGRLHFMRADARDLLRNGHVQADAAYIDPMFPPKRKTSALASKEIRLVRQIVGEDEDAIELLHLARERVPRVVVKRPHHAKPLAENPTATITSNLVRYDVYV